MESKGGMHGVDIFFVCLWFTVVVILLVRVSFKLDEVAAAVALCNGGQP